MLCRLIYASEAAVALGPELVETLLAQARHGNELRGITGMLAFDSRCFLQAIEGDGQVLSDLYARLLRDPRHRRLLLLGHERIAERLFYDWSMGFASADGLGRGLYLRHGSAARFDPHALDATAALAVLRALNPGLARAA